MKDSRAKTGSAMLCNDADLQELILPVFIKKMGVWDGELGKSINRVLQGNKSTKFKSVLLEQFLRGIDPSKEFLRLQQFFNKYFTMPQKGTYM